MRRCRKVDIKQIIKGEIEHELNRNQGYRWDTHRFCGWLVDYIFERLEDFSHIQHRLAEIERKQAAIFEYLNGIAKESEGAKR